MECKTDQLTHLKRQRSTAHAGERAKLLTSPLQRIKEDICEKSSLQFLQSSKCRSWVDINHIPPFVSEGKTWAGGGNNVTEKNHLPLGSDFIMKYNQLFVGEVLNSWVWVSRKLAVFLYFTVRKISIKSLCLMIPSSNEGENMCRLLAA